MTKAKNSTSRKKETPPLLSSQEKSSKTQVAAKPETAVQGAKSVVTKEKSSSKNVLPSQDTSKKSPDAATPTSKTIMKEEKSISKNELPLQDKSKESPEDASPIAKTIMTKEKSSSKNELPSQDKSKESPKSAKTVMTNEKSSSSPPSKKSLIAARFEAAVQNAKTAMTKDKSSPEAAIQNSKSKQEGSSKNELPPQEKAKKGLIAARLGAAVQNAKTTMSKEESSPETSVQNMKSAVTKEESSSKKNELPPQEKGKKSTETVVMTKEKGSDKDELPPPDKSKRSLIAARLEAAVQNAKTAMMKETSNGKDELPLSAKSNKTLIAARLETAVQSAETVNRSPDLVRLTRGYDAMRKNLKCLVQSSKDYHQAYMTLDEKRADMVKKFSALSTGTPIHDHIGKEGGISLSSVVQESSSGSKVYAAKFQDSVIDCIVEWEDVVGTRVDRELQETNALAQKMSHYQSKVEGLRAKVNASQHKGREPTPELADKLARNEEKLDSAWRANEETASKLCNLLDEVTVHGWKDLLPIVKSYVDLDMGKVTSEHQIFSKLSTAATELTAKLEASSKEVIAPKLKSDEKHGAGGSELSYPEDEKHDSLSQSPSPPLSGLATLGEKEEIIPTTSSSDDGNNNVKVTVISDGESPRAVIEM